MDAILRMTSSAAGDFHSCFVHKIWQLVMIDRQTNHEVSEISSHDGGARFYFDLSCALNLHLLDISEHIIINGNYR